MNIRFLTFFLLLTTTCQFLAGAALIEDAGKKLLPAEKKFFTTREDEIRERQANNKKKRAEILASDKEFNANTNAAIDQLKNQITTLEQALRVSPENEFIKQRLELNLDRFQSLNDLKYSRAEVIRLMGEIDKLDQEFLADPDQKKLAQVILGKDKSAYSFDEDLLPLYEKILEREKEIASFAAQESNANEEIENRKRAAQLTIESYQAKKEKKENEPIGLTAKQKADIESLRELAFNDRKALDAMRISEAEYKYTLVRTKLFNAKEQLSVLKKVLATIKPLTKVSEADVALTLEELEKKRGQSFAVKEGYRQEIDKLGIEQRDKTRELEAVSKRYNIALGTELDEWAKDPKRSAAAYVALAQVGTLNDELLLIKKKKELLEAQLALEEEKLRDETLRNNVKDSFSKMVGSRFNTEDDVSREMKKYDTAKAENKANFALYKERQNTIESVIASQKKALENLKAKQQTAENDKISIFKDSSIDYEQYIALLKHAEEKVQEQLDLLSKINSVYTDILTRISSAGKHLDFISAELGSITIWYRPEHAISLDGIRNSLPDVKAFIKDVKDYVNKIDFSSLWQKVKNLFVSPWQLILFLIKLLLIIMGALVIKRYLPYITNKLVSIEQAPVGVRWTSILTAVFLGFGIKHIVSLAIWVTLFILLRWYPCPDPYIYILFYLFSIPYLLYLANRFMRYLVYFNEKYNYIFLSKDYQERFVIVFSTLIYATIIIVFFREAFILGNYHKSELPTILLAINFIIFQIAAILLLSKDQILSLISTRSDFGKWIYELVDQYYYLLQVFLIAIIVMSNPYVGYGRLVLFILKRLLYTAILIQLLMWIQEWFKRVSSRIFFYFDSDEEIARDRFSYAKTWYGLLVIIILAAFTFIGLLIAARIWHWPDVLLNIKSWSDVMGWINKPFLLENTKSPISLYSLFQIIKFVFIGSLVAFIINKFVLGRIFDILLIDAGVQNTIASLIRYVIIIASIIFGFQAIGLADQIWYLLAALVLGVGWVIKDPAADLISYFILIVQRPIKVGDYVFMDENTNGVVRRITPRSVEIRRKNSTTVIIPNTQVTSRTVTNWNHARGFIAFDDIMVTIPYKIDPAHVRELLMRVLDESRVVLKNPRPIIRLENFSDLGYVFLVRGFLSSNHTLDMWDIASDIRFAIVKRLHEHGIEIAYPVRIMVSNSGTVDKK
jgi:small-conductance mechanosensitive channel